MSATADHPVASTSAPAAVQHDLIVGRANCKLVSQGAEARIWETVFCQRPTLIKERFRKQYRHAILDTKLRESRLKQEVRAMLKARKVGVPAPLVYYTEPETCAIYMERIPGPSVKHALREGLLDEAGVARVMADIGRLLALLHDSGLVHGDLTTSNMMVREGDGAVVLIDFGLSCSSTLPEDKAVDLYVLERAIASAHSGREGLFEAVMAAYERHSRQWSATHNRLAEVRMRGRKRTMVG